MIKSFRHKGLKVFFETGTTRGIQASHAKRLSRMLQFMNQARRPEELDIPGWRLHQLHGEFAEYYSLTVSGNWRLIFKMTRAGVESVDYLDYH